MIYRDYAWWCLSLIGTYSGEIKINIFNGLKARVICSLFVLMQVMPLLYPQINGVVHSSGIAHFLTDNVVAATVRFGECLRGLAMALHKRVLLLGPTGVDKGAAATRLSAHIEKRHGHKVHYVDFEHDHLKPAIDKFGFRNFFTFLTQDSSRQAMIWKSAWDSCAKSLEKNTDIVVLGLHATYVNTVVGLRCPVDLPSVCNSFQPTLVVTLTDDVQSMWFRTEKRADGRDARGRPSFEELLTARRAEQLLGDMVVTHSTTTSRHIMVAVSNALVALSNAIIFDAQPTYLSFPISAPRRMEAKGDRSFIELLNELHRIALKQMEADTTRCFITPLAIDELPMIKRWELNQKEPLAYLDTRDRWPQRDLWGGDNLAILPAIEEEYRIPWEQIEPVAGIVATDVGWRDRRLVLQSQSLAICCPKDPEKDAITRGVKTELESAIAIGIASFYWQNPKWDKGGFVAAQFGGAGSMGLGATEALVRSTESLEALVQAKP